MKRRLILGSMTLEAQTPAEQKILARFYLELRQCGVSTLTLHPPKKEDTMPLRGITVQDPLHITIKGDEDFFLNLLAACRQVIEEAQVLEEVQLHTLGKPVNIILIRVDKQPAPPKK